MLWFEIMSNVCLEVNLAKLEQHITVAVSILPVNQKHQHISHKYPITITVTKVSANQKQQ